MSNLFKSKFFLGVVIAVVMLVGVAAFAVPSLMQLVYFHKDLESRFKSAEVKCLQATVGVAQDGSFGPKTKAAVVA